jgi:cation transport ATPase
MNVEPVLRSYFSGEKSEAVLILLAGVACLLAALWLWFGAREPFARGLAAALLLTAALGLAVGGSVYLRTDAQVRQLVELQRSDPVRFAAQEEPRIRQVVRSFGRYRVGYAGAVLLALVLVFVAGRPLYHGLAVGLLILAALGFTIDFYAESRAVRYVQALESIGAIAR